MGRESLRSTISSTNETAEIVWEIYIDEVGNTVAKICASDCIEGRKLKTVDAACCGAPAISA